MVVSRENKLKQLEHRLSEIEHQRKDPATTTVSIEREPEPSTSPATSHLYQCSSSFATLSVEASEAVQSSTISTARGIGESVHELSNLIHTGCTVSSLKDHYLSRVSVECPLKSLETLPVDLVISVLRKIKDDHPPNATHTSVLITGLEHGSVFLHGYVISDISLIENICRRVYFPTDPVSTGLVTSMYGLLYFLLRESLMLGEQLGNDYDLKKYVARCKHNFNVGIETYDVLAVPSFDNILSLTLGVSGRLTPLKCLLISHRHNV